ncbi:MAG: hypothetical protein ABSD20_11955 [Terriglobales bacterium]|jgi:hypothetical protein
MTSDLMYNVVLTMALLFMGLWLLILGIGFALSWRDDGEQASSPGTGLGGSNPGLRAT